MNTQYPPAAAAVTFEEESESEDEEYIVDALALLRVVYGEVDSADFPLPLEMYEAGPCKNGQRRYLFTDAFAVLAYQTLAEWYTAKEDVQRANVYHRAVERLIAAVHDSLGKPRNRGPASKMRECAISPTGFVGLRTGKPSGKKETDHGTRYDGLFWNHIDKWLLALVRANHINDGIRIAKSCFPAFFYETITLPYSPDMVVEKGGMHHKLSVDGTLPPLTWEPQEQSYDDTLNALVVFQMLESKNQHKDTISLQTEINKLRLILRNPHSYSWESCQSRQPDLRCDPGGGDLIEWGMTAILDQFVAGHPRTSNYQFYTNDQRHLLLGMFYHYDARRWIIYSQLIGVSVYNSVISDEEIDDLLDTAVRIQPVRYERVGSHPQENDRKAGMQRVLLAMALLSPGALERRTDDVMVTI